MPRRSVLHVLWAAAAMLTTGCTGDDSSAVADTDVGTAGTAGAATDGGLPDTGGSDASADSTGETGEPPTGPHALGTIVLGESHPADGGTATPIVSASFIPDAALTTAACTTEVAGCQIAAAPDCGKTGCDVDQYCSFDDLCASSCLDICDAACGPGEVCYFPSPGNSACKAIETFDAGVLTFAGTTTALTLFPPYSFNGEASGAPFAPGAALGVDASGATEAGYNAFNQEFTATDLLQTNLEDITLVEAYGNGPVPVTWTPGSESVTVTAAVLGAEGTSGSITCDADDAAGSFDFPREAIDALLDGETLSNVSLIVTRRRAELYTGLETTGELLETVVQEEGWLEMVTQSSETHSIEGCGFGEAVCDNECVDVSSDPANCGGCGDTCAMGDQCFDSDCSGPAACNECFTAGEAMCQAATDACDANADCVNLQVCIAPCADQACIQDCANMYPDGIDDYNNTIACLCDLCVDECAGLC